MNNRKIFYIASIEEEKPNNDNHDEAINEFFDKRPKTTNSEPKGTFIPVEEPAETFEEPRDLKPEKDPKYFVSPMLGKKEINNDTETITQKSGTKRYDGYRKKSYSTPEEVKERYGRNYSEYGVYDTEQYIEIMEKGTVSERKERTPRKVATKVETPKEPIQVEDVPVQPVVEKEKQPEPSEVARPTKKVTSKKKFSLPPLSILNKASFKSDKSNEWAKEQAAIINQTFINFSYGAEVSDWIQGPSVTQFLISIRPGTNVNKIRSFEKDLLMALAAQSIRIQDPIPGKSYAGIEIPNLKRSSVFLGNLIDNPKFLNDSHPLLAALGLDIGGEEVYVDVEKMPHGLVAGTTGSGKSVSINAIIVSLLYRNTPEQLRLILIDPKMVEFAFYDDIPHLALPVITDPKKASAALRWATEEMDKRFLIFKSAHVKNLEAYNAYVNANGGTIMPAMVIIIDELADLMSVAASEVEGNIQRITAKARAAGIHLIVATQRPSTDVIRGTIKNNIPVRAAFQVSSYTDSNTILDHGGAEKLLGNGDMLFGDGKSERRLQGAYISDEEIAKLASFLRNQGPVSYLIDESELDDKTSGYVTDGEENDVDELFDEIALYAVRNKVASVNRIMQVFNISFNRANRLFTQFESLGIVSGTVKGKQREILVTEDELKDILNGGN